MSDADEGQTPPGERPARAPRQPAEHAAAQPKRKRASRRLVRAWAWILGVLSFLSPLALLGLSPKPASAAASSAAATTTARPKRPVVIVVTKRIVYTKSPTSSVSTTGSGPTITYVPAPSTSSAATTCATPPC